MAKIYAVKKGLTPGIYKTWDECKAQVEGYSGAIYKSFKDTQISEAINFIGTEHTDADSSIMLIKDLNNNKSANKSKHMSHVDIYVDGSFKYGNYSYGFVVVNAIGEIIHKANGLGNNEEAAKMQSVAGELSAAMHAICWAHEHGYKCKIYHDNKGIGEWARGTWKAKNKHTKGYVDFIKQYTNTILEFEWVKGHAGNKYNEIADKLAGQAFDVLSA